ncbi:pentatricopeptide repeat-containing protein [Pyrus ussuriensis x Pyrus communis]|uniref:Pentatricopeptide repeat-containing protein n=1 Tax=Pyrus ussuriensis x Pyrus communis TaxID=2448454 RepID=A0A5N5G9C6_9ROSA|nr:pentatricopeptide repeat-containing protein [Pyrus ussuriensis x Pyrus communis]
MSTEVEWKVMNEDMLWLSHWIMGNNELECGEDFEAVGRFLDEMKTHDGKKGNWSAYSNLADIYVKAELFKKANELYHFFISLYACTSNLSGVKMALCELNDIEELKEMFEEWESICSKYDTSLANVAIRGYLSQGMHEEAELIFANACKKTKGKGSFLEAREMLMVHSLNTRKVDLADNHLGAAVLASKDGEWHPSPATKIAFLKYFEDKKDADGAEKFCKILKCLGYLSCNEYCLLLKTCIAAGKLEPAMRRRLKEKYIEISPELENLLQKVSASELTAP